MKKKMGKGLGMEVFIPLGEAMRRTWEEEDLGEGLVARGTGVWDVESLNGGILTLRGILPDRVEDIGQVRWKVSHVECYLSI